MWIKGEWYLCDDGIVRPVIRGSAQDRHGHWRPVLFLVDVGADRTVFSDDVAQILELPSLPPSHQLEGLGGSVDFAVVETTIRLLQASGEPVLFRGQFATVTDPAAMDMSMLGRDITNLFAAIVDRPGNAVCLLGQRRRYVIVED